MVHFGISILIGLVGALGGCGGKQPPGHPDDVDVAYDSIPFVDTGGMGVPLGQEDYDHDGYVATEDCDNTDPAVHPGAVEVCNEADDDCDGFVDEGDGSYVDTDRDGFGGRLLTACDTPGELVAVAPGGDCNDEDPAIHPGAEDPECDQVDQDCDGLGAEAARFDGGVVFDTVQGALDAASVGKIITICSGQHAEHLIAADGAELELRSFDGNPAATYFDGESSGRILSVRGGSITIRNLGFRNGYVEWLGEPGEYSEEGAAILSSNSDLLLIGSHFENNQADYGEAVSWGSLDSKSHPVDRFLTVDGSTFSNNFATGRGGDVSIGGLAYGMVWISVSSSVFSQSSSQRQGGAVSVNGGFPFTLSAVGNTFEAVDSGQGGGCIFLSFGVDDFSLESGPIVISNSLFNGCEADGDGGAVRVASDRLGYEYPIVVDISSVTFVENTSTGHGAAVQFEGDSPIEATITDTIFDQHASGGGGSAIASIDEKPTTIRCERCTITGGQAGFEGGAVDIDNFATFESIDSDWGSLSTNNSPNDLVIPDYLYRNLGEHESFSCSPDVGCTIEVP